MSRHGDSQCIIVFDVETAVARALRRLLPELLAHTHRILVLLNGARTISAALLKRHKDFVAMVCVIGDCNFHYAISFQKRSVMLNNTPFLCRYITWLVILLDRPPLSSMYGPILM